ncbi:MAG: hypothetical protein AAF502_17985 [Bacteroidota bacterium]
MEKYIILEANSIYGHSDTVADDPLAIRKGLQGLVNKKIEQGYKPQGGIALKFNDYGTVSRYYQAMTLRE